LKCISIKLKKKQKTQDHLFSASEERLIMVFFTSNSSSSRLHPFHL